MFEESVESHVGQFTIHFPGTFVVENYISYYIPLDEEIDIHALTSLTASMIESLITKIGPRAKFTTKLQEYKNEKASVRYIINIST